jgi:hypothetical protein
MKTFCGILRWDFSPFMQMYITRDTDLSPGLRLPPSIQSHSPLCIPQHRSLATIGQKKASSHSLVFTKDTCLGTESRAQVRRLFNIHNSGLFEVTLAPISVRIIREKSAPVCISKNAPTIKQYNRDESVVLLASTSATLERN